MPKEPEVIINALNQKVRVYDWEEYQKRLSIRKPFTKDIDLAGKTLVINHTWGLGDVLYMTSALKGLKEKFPTCKLICQTVFPDVLEGNPDVDQNVHYMDSQQMDELLDSFSDDWFWLDYDTPLKGGDDYKIHLRTKPQLNEFMKSLLMKNPKELNNDERDFVQQASTSVITRYQRIALDMYCAHAHVSPTVKSVWYYPTEHELLMAKKFIEPLKEKGKKVITLMPHSSSKYKDYPHWLEVTRLCPDNYFWLILDSVCRENEPWTDSNMFNLAGAFKLRQSAAVIIESDLNCSSDTGLLYPKAARGGKCVVTYGPHEPQPFLHYFPSAHGLRVEHLNSTKGMEGMCSTGCFIDTESCHVKGNPAPCLQELSPKVVAEKIMELLEK